MRKGLFQVYTGDGKGKTTAAMGLIVRALGHGLSVCFIQFMKESGPIETGESAALAALSGTGIGRFEHHRFGRSFIYKPRPTPEEVSARIAEGVALAKNLLTCPADGERDTSSCRRPDLLILDEALSAHLSGVLPLEDLLELARIRPPEVELVMTGRGAPEAIIEAADLVTEMRMIRHPYDEGIGARAGIEY